VQFNKYKLFLFSSFLGGKKWQEKNEARLKSIEQKIDKILSKYEVD
jgi:hypothetical protein